MRIPWYFDFLVSWKEASREIDTFWTSYEELFGDRVGTLSRILEFQNLPVDIDQIKAGILAMEREDTNRNQGVSGRGNALSDGCKQIIMQVAECWKIDKATLAKVGIQSQTE